MDLQLPVRVLIAEDDPMVCSLHVQAVRQLSGFAVAGTVSDGFELLEFFKRNTADLIVMDIFMPRLSGLEALKRLRSRGNTSDVILVSAGKKADLVSRARTLGAFDYMIKPYSLQRFRASLENYMEHMMRLRAVRDETTQEEVDAFFEIGHRSSGPAGEEEVLPKGFQRETLALVRNPGRIRQPHRPGTGRQALHLPFHGTAIPRIPRRKRAGGDQFRIPHQRPSSETLHYPGQEMTGRRPSAPASAGIPGASGRERREIRRCLEEILLLTGDAETKTMPPHSAADRSASIRRLAEEALSLLGGPSFLPDEKKAPEKAALFSITSVCFAAAGSAAAKGEPSCARWKSTVGSLLWKETRYC